jgi:hypothetical protein
MSLSNESSSTKQSSIAVIPDRQRQLQRILSQPFRARLLERLPRLIRNKSMPSDPDERLHEINCLLFCEECHRRALDFLESAESAVSQAGSENVTTLQAKVDATLESFLLLHAACPSCKEGC